MTGTKEDGVMKGTITGEDPYAFMTPETQTFNRTIKDDDVIKVRIKSEPGTGRGFEVFLFTDAENSVWGNGEYMGSTANYIPNGQWQTITIPIKSQVVGTRVRGVRFDPSLNEGGEYKNSGTYECDWIYIGSEAAFTQGDPISNATTASDAAKQWQIKGSADISPAQPKFSGDDVTYGQDALYDKDIQMSGNSIHYVFGQGVAKLNPDKTVNYGASTAYTEVSFDFTGTGFDIISRTGPQQGGLRAMIYNQSDGSFVKVASVIIHGNEDFYQVPVLSVELPEHGDYTVKLFVNAPYTNTSYPSLRRGGEFYFDAIRIYNPIDVNAGTADAKVAYNAYLNHGEAHGVITEIRNILIGTENLEAGGALEGAVYLNADTLASSDVELCYTDAEGNRLARSQETALGDFAADALYYYFSSRSIEVDAAVVTGKSLHAALPSGSLYTSTLKGIHPYGHLACVQRVTGQQLLDALEWGARRAGSGESAAFLQVSGINYEIHIGTAANVVEKSSRWAGTVKEQSEYRVRNVMIGGKALDLNATYNIAGYRNILVDAREGFTMFADTSNVTDNGPDGAAILLNYAKAFSNATVTAQSPVLNATYANTNGMSRIIFVSSGSVSEWPTEDPVEDGEFELSNKPQIRDYKQIGPNQEVYLTCNTGIAFKVEAINGIPARLDIGAKSADGKPVTLNIAVDTKAPTGLPTTGGRSITSCTAQYYPVDISLENWVEVDGKYCTYVTVSNTSQGILSLTDIKYAYDTPVEQIVQAASLARGVQERALRSGSRYLRFVVDEAMSNALTQCTEHENSLQNNGHTHSVTCTKCGNTEYFEHTFENGVCTCGAAESAAPLYDTTMTHHIAVTVGAEMSVGYSFMAEALSEYAEFYLEVSKAVAGGEPTVTRYGIEDLEAVTSGGEVLMYKAVYTGINAKEMGDEFTARVCAVDENGRSYYGPSQTASIKSILLERFENASTEFRTMAIDMLNYGAAAQVRLNYNTKNLVNADLTDEQKVCGTREIPVAEDNAGTDGEGVAINAAITVGSRVELGVSALFTASESAKCVITDEEGSCLASLDAEPKYDVMFSAKYGEVGAREMRKVIKVAFFDGEKQISQTMIWSVESYVAQIREKVGATEAEVNMVNAMLAYGDAVAAYLASCGQ